MTENRRPRKDVAAFRTLGDLETEASRAVDEAVWGYIQGGSGDEETLRGNREAFRRWTLRPRMLADVRAVDLRTTMLGSPVRAPFFVAPTAYQGEIHPDGERGSARAAGKAGVLAVFSTLSSAPLEAIARVVPAGPRWFQLYLQRDFAASARLVRRAERSGYSALVVTVDTPVLGSRDRQVRSGFAFSTPVPVGNGVDARSPPRAAALNGGRYRLPAPADQTWEVIDRLGTVTKLPIVVKGVLTADDARRALDHGARGVVVSNHGGRQLDRAPSALDALPEVVTAVGDRAEVYYDGGIRRGSDVLIALALGARAVGLGRPVLWALAVGGGSGVERFLALLAADVATSLALAGRRSVAELDRSLLGPGTPGP
ncbi:MAG: alpha-hydroxy acid oxidase [Thermoplasmata archaeon]